MKHILKLILLTTVMACGTGCSTGYWIDRGRDSADIFTVTVGYGSGVAARVGPFSYGVMQSKDVFGIRGGVLGEFSDKNESTWGLFLLDERFSHPEAETRGKDYLATTLLKLKSEKKGSPKRTPKQRYTSSSGKSYNMNWSSGSGEEVFVVIGAVVAVVVVSGAITLPVDTLSEVACSRRPVGHWPYFTQVEIAGGWGATARIGFNPGELLDFVLGFTTLDIYNDDYEHQKAL